MGKITKNYIYNLLYQLFVMLVPLITAPYLASVLGANGTGIYSYIFSTTTIIVSIMSLGIFNYGNRQIAYVRDNQEKRSEVFWQVMSVRMVLLLFCTIVYAIVIIIVDKYLFLFLVFYLYVIANFVDCTWLYVGVEDMKWAVIKNTITKIISVAGIFIFVKSKDDIPVYVFIQGISVLISNILAYSQLRLYVCGPIIDFRNFKNIVKGSALLFLPGLAVTIYSHFDKVMIELMTGATNEVAFYDYSVKIVTIPLTFITVLSTVIMPRIANEFCKGNVDNISKMLNKSAKFSMFLSFPMVAGLLACADKLIPWYLGDEFKSTVVGIMLISPIIIANSLLAISGGQYFTATDQVGILIKSQFLSLIANIVINALLIPCMGFAGAAVATVLTSITCAIIQYIYLTRQVILTGVIKCGTKYLFVSMLMYGVIRIITSNMEARPMTSILQVLIGTLFYIIILCFLHDEQITIAKNIILKRKK